MVKNKDRWSALSMKDRAALIDIYVKSGITDLGEIRKDYNSFSDGGGTTWEKVDKFVDAAEPWTSGASLALAGATAAIPAIAPVSVPAMAAANYAGVLMDGYQAFRDFQDKDYKSGVWNSVEALTGMFGAKAASKLAHTAGGRAIGKFKEQLVKERFNSSGDKIARLMRKGLTYEKAAERVMQNAVNYVDNSSKVKDVTEGIKKSYSEKFNKGAEIVDSIFDAADVGKSVFSRFKEEHPVEIYKCGGKLNKFATGGYTNNTLLSREEYLNNKRQEIIDASLNNSRNRTEPTSPLIPMFESEEEWRDATTKELETVNSKLSDSEFWINNIDLLYQRKDLIDRKKILEEELSKPYTTKYHKGASCIYTATDNYGKKYRAASNYQIHQNPEKYGFIRIDPNDAKPGDILQMGLSHAITYDHMGDDGHIIYNQSGGGSTKEAIGVGRRAANKGFDSFSSAYRFIGLQEDNDKWNSEYNNYRKDYSNNIVNTLKDVPTINTNIILEAPTRKLDGSENEQTLSGVRPITDTEKVEYVIRKSKGSTGDMKDPDNWGPLIRMGIAYGKKEVPVGWSVNDIPTKNDYTGAMMEGVGRMTDNNMGFVSTDDLVDELGYAPDDFVDAYTKNIIPFKELGVIEKTGSGEKKILTNAIGGREVSVYQTYKDTLSSRDLKYLYGELEKAIPKKGDTIYSTNSTSPSSPFKIGNSNIYYDGNNHSVVQVKLPDGKTAFKALDYYDFNPDHWGYDVLPKAKEALQFLNDKGNPYVMTTPWYLQEDTRSIEDRLLDYGIEYNSDGTLYIGKDANGKKWSYEEALADIEKHPYL